MDDTHPSNPLDAADIPTHDDTSNAAAASPRLVASRAATDAELMQRYRDGDVYAFETLYTRHKRALYRYLQRMCRNREAVNDLFQESWSKLIASRHRYEPRAQFTTYLFHIAHNCAVDYFRRAERQHIGRTDDVNDIQERLAGAEADRPDHQISEAQLQAAFERALAQLPEEQRNVFVLREETGLSLEEIGVATGVTMETAKSRLRYALAKLRTALQPFEPRTPVTSKPL